MRKLMWFAIGFTAACAAGVYLLSGHWLLLAALCSLPAIFVIFFRTDHARCASIAMLGCTVGFLWVFVFECFYINPVKQYDTQILDLTIEATDYSYAVNNAAAVEGTVQICGRRYAVLCYLNADDAVCPGNQISGQFQLRLTARGTNSVSTYHAGSGVLLLAYLDGDAQVVPKELPLKYSAAWLRRQIISVLDATFPEDTAAFARALLLGDDSELSYKTDTDFKVSGIRHVIAVSGLHVSILFSLIYTLCARKRILTALIGIPLLILFAALAGFTPSIVRACVMQALMILAVLLEREYDPPTALAASVLVMLACNPLTISSVSFQLSVGCMAGIFLFSQKIYAKLLKEKYKSAKGIKAKQLRWLTASVSITVSTMLVTMPLCALYFGTVSVIGIVTNLLTLWVISFIFYGVMLSCVLGAICLPVGAAVATVVSVPIRYVLYIAALLADIPFAAVYTKSQYICIWLVGCYLLLAVFMLSKYKKPGILCIAVALTFVLSICASYIEPRLDDYRITMLDVGQGQSIIIQHKQKYYVVDCGNETGTAADIASQTLLSQGVGTIDGLILTHYDEDHAGGAADFMTRINVETLYLPPKQNDTVCERLAQSDTQIAWINTDCMIEDDDMCIYIYTAHEGATGNESSLCILFQMQNCDILITGDRSAAGEEYLLNKAELPKLDILVVGHHGSKDATSLQLLNATEPACALISVGANNPFGHPAPQILEKLNLFGCRILRTDQYADIVIRG